MGRTHIHFATGEPALGKKADAADGKGAANEGEEAVVVSGMRGTASVLVWVDVRRAMEEGGIAWWRSGNGVVLTEGDGEGMVGLRFVRRVVRRGSGEVIWSPEGVGPGEGR